MKKLFSIITFLVFFSATAWAGGFAPSFSLLTYYAHSFGERVVTYGDIDLTSNKINWGFDIAQKIDLSQDCFLSVGLRVNTFNGSAKAKGLSFSDYTWRKEYVSVAVPVAFGKNFETKKGHSGDYAIGVSAGLFGTFYEGSDAGMNDNAYFYLQDSISMQAGSSPMFLSPVFFSSLDVSAHYQPFKKVQRLNVGAMCSFQISKAASADYNAYVREYPGERHNYKMQATHRFFYGGISIRYQLGKMKAEKRYRGTQSGA